MESVHTKLFYLFFFLAFSCEKIPYIDASNLSWEIEQAQMEEDGLRSEQRFQPSSMSEETYQGAINAVKKAYQLTDITFSPLQPIDYNIGTYQANTSYTGMIYSSVKEIGTYVGSNVSFHTFMTAIHNPRSRIYTDRIDEPPYQGTDCRSYYGTVCSGLVSYALGVSYGSYDFVASDEMQELDYSDVDGFHIADILWRSGHVAMITNVIRNQDDAVVSIEISEAVKSGCKRYSISRSSFLSSYSRNFKRVFRYSHLERNLDYTSIPEFVPVFDETVVPFKYNDDICVDKGDRSCYFVGDKVILNILSMGDRIEIFKDGVFLSSIDVNTEDILLTDLEYGYYQARLIKGDQASDFTSWIMVDYSIESSKSEGLVYFRSCNSLPKSFSFCNEYGSRKYPFTEILCRSFTEDEVSLGFICIPQDKVKSDRQYFKITFETDFGRISTTPTKWL